MSKNHQCRRLIFGIVTVLALTLLAPGMVTAEEDVAALAAVAAPVAEELRSDAEWAANRVLAAQHALLTGDVGSMQEERLYAIIAAAPSWDETSGYRSVEASRATIGHPAAITTSEQTRLFAAQQALLSLDLGSLQEEALAAVVAASSAAAEASIDDALAPTSAELFAQFRTIELALSQSLGAD